MTHYVSRKDNQHTVLINVELLLDEENWIIVGNENGKFIFHKDDYYLTNCPFIVDDYITIQPAPDPQQRYLHSFVVGTLFKITKIICMPNDKNHNYSIECRVINEGKNQHHVAYCFGMVNFKFTKVPDDIVKLYLNNSDNLKENKTIAENKQLLENGLAASLECQNKWIEFCSKQNLRRQVESNYPYVIADFK